jgi:hypothetical protein
MLLNYFYVQFVVHAVPVCVFFMFFFQLLKHFQCLSVKTTILLVIFFLFTMQTTGAFFDGRSVRVDLKLINSDQDLHFLVLD